MRRLASLLLPVVIAIMLGAIALGGYLGFGSARMAYLALIDSRLGEIAARIDAAAEQALGLGLPLAGQDTLDALAARERAADPLIVSIDVLDAEGIVVHSSDRSRTGRPAQAGDGVRVHRSAILGPFGATEGQVWVRADSAGIDAPLGGLAQAVLRAVVVAGLASIVLVVPAVLLPLARLGRQAGLADGAAAADFGWALRSLGEAQDRLAGAGRRAGDAVAAGLPAPRRRPVPRFDRLVIALLAGILLVAVAFVAGRTVVAAERILLPALDARAEVSARSLAGLVGTAAGYGIGLDALYGTGAVLDAVVAENRQFAAAALLDPAGRPVAVALRADGDIVPAEAMPAGLSVVSAPVAGPDGRPYARVEVAVPPSVAVDLVRDLWLDIAIVVLASVLMTLEVLAFVLGLDAGALMQAFSRRLDALRRGDLSRPGAAPASGQGRLAQAIAAVDGQVAGVRARHVRLRADAAAAGDAGLVAALDHLDARFRLSQTRAEPPPVLQRVRLPLFLFFLAEEMTRPFLPGFAASLTAQVSGIPRELAISLPIVVFMAIVAFSQPWLAGLTERFGRARALRLGAAVAVAGFAGTACASGLGPLLLFRALVAIGYAAVFVGAQGIIIDNTAGPTRARGLALLVTAIMVAALCGPPVGGILADRLGVRAAFVVCACVAALAFLIARFTLPADHVNAGARIAGVSVRDIARVLTRPAMALLLVGCAFPAKLILAGLSFFLVPVVMGAAGFDDAVIGRVLMLYAVSMLVLVPLVARWSDGAGRRPAFVVGGALVAATAVVHPLWLPQPWGAAAMVLQLGLGQALSITPQSALVGEIGRRIAPDLPENTLYGVFRLVERLGNAAGPALAALLLARFGAPAALAGIGAIVAAGALGFALASRQAGGRSAGAAGGRSAAAA